MADPLVVTMTGPASDTPLSAFLARHGWAGASREAVGSDSSPRQYCRLRLQGRTAILMESAPDGSAAAAPGHSMRDFLRIGEWLRGIGLHAPEVFDADMTGGFMLMEDLGDTSFKCALEGGTPASEVYGLAVDVLARLQRADCPLALPDYYESHVHKGRRRVIDWYMPVALGRTNPDGLAEGYLSAWDAIEKTLPPCPQGFLHIDYHVENLMWMPQLKGQRACGVLDFQGAMRGPLPYDLANLTEDPRHEVAEDLRRAMLARYCAGLSGEERDVWMAWHRVLATQFHCRVIGQFIRLAVRDGKARYLDYLPRVAGYLTAGLADPLLKPLNQWFKTEGLAFDMQGRPDLHGASRLIRPDAF